MTSARQREVDSPAMKGDYSITGYLDWLLRQALQWQASDVHIETARDRLAIRLRIDGRIYTIEPPDAQWSAALIARVKVLANLNAAETRLPQDGRFSFMDADHRVDIRVATLPTERGETVVLRLLDASSLNLDLASLGMPETTLAEVTEVIRHPHGVFIVTGPTGAGKTTTLYSILQAVSDPAQKIVTVEDPVEYTLPGVVQVNVQPRLEVTFATVLRSILRHDPDRILVGEIRDAETAQMALQAALTGHYVYTTLHTRDAIGVVTRLREFGIADFLLSATLQGVLAQRLLRRIDPQAREPYTPSSETLRQLGLTGAEAGTFYRGLPTAPNHQTGYRGRLGIFQFWKLTEADRTAIHAHESEDSLRQRLYVKGMPSLRSAALEHLQAGETTVEEVLQLDI